MNKQQKVLITKASGEKVPFDAARLRRSLERSKARPEVIDEVVASISAMVYDNMSTKQIYKKAFEMLRRRSRPVAARYKLKNAIMELGPAGYAFEKFIAALLRAEGYETDTGIIVQGTCVKHEVDVVAERGLERCMIECKFHGQTGNYSDVKVALYIRSRYVDVSGAWRKDPQHEGKDLQGWVVTNTRFTEDAVTYAQCIGLHLVSWDTPNGSSIKERIDRSGLYPVTSLTTLTAAEKKALLDMDVVLSADLLRNPALLPKIGVHKRRWNNIEQELTQLCRT